LINRKKVPEGFNNDQPSGVVKKQSLWLVYYRACLNIEDILMRKRIINSDDKQKVNSDQEWLDIEKIAVVEVTSEEEAFPVESALLPGNGSGWRASGQGKQTIRLVFDNPQKLQWIRLKFEELETERTQEYVLRWSADGSQSYQEIVRQQWNFNPEDSTCEVEDYQVDLPAVSVLELSINPDISDSSAFASLKELRLA
jgi:hypothetical protein